jgi:hypothetical protein
MFLQDGLRTKSSGTVVPEETRHHVRLQPEKLVELSEIPKSRVHLRLPQSSCGSMPLFDQIFVALNIDRYAENELIDLVQILSCKKLINPA